jgi:hypothetical protein
VIARGGVRVALVERVGVSRPAGADKLGAAGVVSKIGAGDQARAGRASVAGGLRLPVRPA